MTYTEAKRKLFKRLYRNLNDKQREAVFTVKGPVLVLAGAGSGKTTVLVNRISHIVNYGDAFFAETEKPEDMDMSYMQYLIDFGDDTQIPDYLKKCAVNPAFPSQVLCVTFTNKAAEEFRTRLKASLGDGASEIWAGTFHSICVRILRRHIHLIDFDNSFTIYDADDSKKTITACLKKLNLSEDILTPASLQNEISRLKEKGYTAEEYAQTASDFRERHVSAVYTEYAKTLKQASALDFDDIILYTNILFDTYPDVLEKYQRKFEYILVDEYQDTNPSQSQLIHFLAGDKKNVCVVGDDDQSIYSFRGATVENILNFDRVFPETKIIRLEQNYRSTQNILTAANEVISNNSGRKGKTLWTDAGDGEKITLKKLATQIEEAQYIVNYIDDKVRSRISGYGDFAVLYRVNAQANAIENALSHAHIPYRIYGGIRFFERKEIKDIIAYLSVISNPRDDVRARRIINVPARGIGKTTIDGLEAMCAREGISLLEAASRAEETPALSRAYPKLKTFCMLIEEMREFAQTHSLSETVDAVMEKTAYKQYLISGEDGEDKLRNAEEFISSAKLFEETSENPSLSAFLEDISLVSDTDDYDADAPKVTLMTVHSAKGLEFNTVFLPGFEEGLFPSSRSMAEKKELEEERRLAYVAMTRARKQLFILHTATRMMYGQTNVNRISRFAEEIPDECIKTENRSGGYSPYREKKTDPYAYSAKSTFVTQPPKTKATVIKAGTRVKHNFFGEGEIVSAEPMGNDVLYEIQFDNGMNKKLLGEYAKLTTIE